MPVSVTNHLSELDSLLAELNSARYIETANKEKQHVKENGGDTERQSSENIQTLSKEGIQISRIFTTYNESKTAAHYSSR